MVDTHSQPMTTGPGASKPSPWRGISPLAMGDRVLPGADLVPRPNRRSLVGSGVPLPSGQVARSVGNVFFAVIGLWAMGALGVWFMRHSAGEQPLFS